MTQKVWELMTPVLMAVSSSQPVADAAKAIREHGAGDVLMIDDGQLKCRSARLETPCGTVPASMPRARFPARPTQTRQAGYQAQQRRMTAGRPAHHHDAGLPLVSVSLPAPESAWESPRRGSGTPLRPAWWLPRIGMSLRTLAPNRCYRPPSLSITGKPEGLMARNTTRSRTAPEGPAADPGEKRWPCPPRITLLITRTSRGDPGGGVRRW